MEKYKIKIKNTIPNYKEITEKEVIELLKKINLLDRILILTYKKPELFNIGKNKNKNIYDFIKEKYNNKKFIFKLYLKIINYRIYNENKTKSDEDSNIESDDGIEYEEEDE